MNRPTDEIRDVFLRTLRKIKRRKRGEGALPKRVPSKNNVRREFTVGDNVEVGVDAEVNPESVEEIFYRVEKKIRLFRNRRPIWLANFTVLFMGERLVGYSNRVLDRQTGSETTIGFDTTGVFKSKEGLLIAIREKLEEWADETHTLIYLLSVSLKNFAYISPRML